jgi:hypothetical protein
MEVPTFGSEVAANSRVNLSHPQPIRYTTIEKDTRFETLQQFKQAVADWAVGAGFNVFAQKCDK